MKKKRERGNSPSGASLHERLAVEAKAIVATAFRNGPIEDMHAGESCPVCEGKPEYSHITQEEMKVIVKTAVDRVFTLLALRAEKPVEYKTFIEFTARAYTHSWDDPTFTREL